VSSAAELLRGLFDPRNLTTFTYAPCWRVCAIGADVLVYVVHRTRGAYIRRDQRLTVPRIHLDQRSVIDRPRLSIIARESATNAPTEDKGKEEKRHSSGNKNVRRVTLW
jgi:hypothetical protein